MRKLAKLTENIIKVTKKLVVSLCLIVISVFAIYGVISLNDVQVMSIDQGDKTSIVDTLCSHYQEERLKTERTVLMDVEISKINRKYYLTIR